LFHVAGGLLKLRKGFLKINNVDFVSVPENERRHFRIPKACLVAKVNTGLKHLPHGYGHKKTPKSGLGLTLLETLDQRGHPTFLRLSQPKQALIEMI
jgi:hypothetical protein